MAAATMRGGHTTPSGEEMAGLRPATEAEKCSAAPRCIETLLLAGTLLRLLLVFILALVSGYLGSGARADAAGIGTQHLRSAQRLFTDPLGGHRSGLAG